MTHQGHNKLVSFIWSIADDCLRDAYVRGKYRDVIFANGGFAQTGCASGNYKRRSPFSEGGYEVCGI